MNLSQNYIVYQAHGNLDIHNELIYSIASFYLQSTTVPVDIIVYTDNTEYLKKYLPSTIIYESLTAAMLKDWRGQIDFVHRVKVEMLIDVCQKYVGNILYLDTDTIFTQSPDILFKAIENGVQIMHTSEGKMTITRNSLFDKIAKFLLNKSFQINGKFFTISTHQEIWNAGVIGFTSNQINLLYDVLALTDALYKQYQKHIMEQLSFSFVFTQNKLLTAAENQIFHYWNFKEFRTLLREYLLVQDTFEKILATSETINPVELIKPKMMFEQQSHLVKQLQKNILKKKWYMPTYSEIKSKSIK
ncbi:hypothetical protein [Flavobacterium sp.]